MHRLTLRARLTSATTAIVAVAVVILGAVAFFTVRIALDSALETRLETTALAIRSVVDVRRGHLQHLDGEDREQFLSILGERTDGAVLWGDGRLMTSNLASPPAAILAAIAARGASHGNVRLEKSTVAYVATPIEENGVRYGTVAAWESRATYDDAVRITLIALGAAGTLVIIAAAATGSTLTRRMLLPVTDLSAMLSEIEASDLTERLAWHGPDDELGRFCRTFDRLLDRLESAFEQERRFTADASHELRTPLTVMRAEVELALMQQRTPEAYRDTLERLQRETRRLEALAESLLLSARNEAGQTSRTVPTGAMLARAVERMQPLAQARAIVMTCEIECDSSIMADPTTIESAVVALIDNALRFAPQGGRVRVGAGLAGADAWITVADDGPGFSEAALREATRRFWREDPSRSGPGSGLGLSIARSVVERLHGTIALRNASLHTGAVVILTVPAIARA